MTDSEFILHLRATGHDTEEQAVNGSTFVIIRGLIITGGANEGKQCDVGILRSAANPWVPQAAVHVRPHLVPMGKACSQASPLGSEWQYLSRRFDKSPTPQAFTAHILTILGET